jgi:hypothetical protein
VKFGMTTYFGKGDFVEGADDFWRLGGDVDVFVGDLNVSAVALRGRDEMRVNRQVTEFTAASVEANYVVTPWIVTILRYDSVLRDDGPDIRRLVPGVALAIRANVRLVAEWEAFLDTSFGGFRQTSGDARGRVRLDIVF